jgi:hypothetical protein
VSSSWTPNFSGTAAIQARQAPGLLARLLLPPGKGATLNPAEENRGGKDWKASFQPG